MKRWTGNPWQRFGLPARRGWLVVGGYGIAAALIVASSILGWEGTYATWPIDNVALVVCLVGAAACAGYAARFAAKRRYRFGWLALATALLGWAVGEIIWAFYDVRPEVEHATHPALAEAVLLIYPVGTMASLVVLSHLSRRSRRRLVLDGVIVWTSLFVISWVFVLEKQLREDRGSRLATLAEVFADVVIMTTAIVMLSRLRPSDLPGRSLLAGGTATVAVADIAMVFGTGMGSYHGGGPADLGRVAGLGMMALAALSSVTESPTATPRNEILSRVLLWLPYLPLVLTAAVGLGYTAVRMEHGPMQAALGILVVAVLARQFVVLVENQDLLSEVSREAFRDSLTGLANRTQFIQRLEEAVAPRRPNAAPIAVLCLDLDNFKLVNDALGHLAGDELLIRVAGRITAALEETGTVARLGGDEFAVLLEGSIEQSQAAAHRVLEAFSAAIVIDGVPVTVRPSIGFTVTTAASGYTVEQLLRHADLAMYAAKREGGQCIRSFVPDLPLPHTFPLFTDSAASAIQGGLTDTAHRGAARNDTALAPASKPISHVAPTASDQPNDGPKGVPWPPIAIRIALAVLAIGVVAFTASSIFNPNTGHSAFFEKYLYTSLNLLAAGLIAGRAYRVAADRLAWILIAAGMTCSAVGDVIYALAVPNGQSPSAADPAYLAYYPLVYSGLLLLMRARLKLVPIPIQLDSLVCGLTVAAVAAALTAGPIHAAATHTPATVLVGVLYPWGDLVLLALAASMLPIVGWRNDFRWALLVAGLILFAVADTDYLFETSAHSYRVGTLLDACWPVSSLLVAMASWAPSSSVAPVPKRGLGPFVTPAACTAVGLGVAILAHNSRLAVTLAALSLVATAARFSVTFRDVSMLAERHKQSMTDELTALPNRRALATALTATSDPSPVGPSSATPASSRRALLLLKLYEFQEINDSVGRRFGDELLCHIANRLADRLRRDDLLARVSDDEFGILLAEGSDLIAARAQADRLLEALSDPFALDPITVQVDARVAIALCPDHCDHRRSC